jgi:hypothetical protein
MKIIIQYFIYGALILLKAGRMANLFIQIPGLRERPFLISVVSIMRVMRHAHFFATVLAYISYLHLVSEDFHLSIG